MITLEYFNGTEWIEAGKFHNEIIAWISLGSVDINYRTVDENGKVLMDKSLRITGKCPRISTKK